MTEQGAVLGVLGLQTWARPAGNAPGPETKESGKWLHGIDQARQAVWETARAAGAGTPPCLLHLMDREGDVYEVLQWVEEVGDSAIIRCVHNRRVEDPWRLAHVAVRAQPALDRVRLTVPRSHGKPARPATVEMRAVATTLCPDREKYPHAWPLTWTLGEAWEPHPVSGREALHEKRSGCPAACGGGGMSVRKAARAIMQCRTAALGGHIQACPDGHRARIWYNSCPHRSCPQCAYLQTERWLTLQRARLLACDHYHVILTVLHDLTPLWLANVPVMTTLLFQAVRATLVELLADPQYLGVQPGSQTLVLHPHVHCLVTGVG